MEEAQQQEEQEEEKEEEEENEEEDGSQAFLEFWSLFGLAGSSFSEEKVHLLFSGDLETTCALVDQSNFRAFCVQFPENALIRLWKHRAFSGVAPSDGGEGFVELGLCSSSRLPCGHQPCLTVAQQTSQSSSKKQEIIGIDTLFGDEPRTTSTTTTAQTTKTKTEFVKEDKKQIQKIQTSEKDKKMPSISSVPGFVLSCSKTDFLLFWKCARWASRDSWHTSRFQTTKMPMPAEKYYSLQQIARGLEIPWSALNVTLDTCAEQQNHHFRQQARDKKGYPQKYSAQQPGVLARLSSRTEVASVQFAIKFVQQSLKQDSKYSRWFQKNLLQEHWSRTPSELGKVYLVVPTLRQLPEFSKAIRDSLVFANDELKFAELYRKSTHGMLMQAPILSSSPIVALKSVLLRLNDLREFRAHQSMIVKKGKSLRALCKLLDEHQAACNYSSGSPIAEELYESVDKVVPTTYGLMQIDRTRARGDKKSKRSSMATSLWSTQQVVSDGSDTHSEPGEEGGEGEGETSDSDQLDYVQEKEERDAKLVQEQQSRLLTTREKEIEESVSAPPDHIALKVIDAHGADAAAPAVAAPRPQQISKKTPWAFKALVTKFNSILSEVTGGGNGASQSSSALASSGPAATPTDHVLRDYSDDLFEQVLVMRRNLLWKMHQLVVLAESEHAQTRFVKEMAALGFQVTWSERQIDCSYSFKACHRFMLPMPCVLGKCQQALKIRGKSHTHVTHIWKVACISDLSTTTEAEE